MENQMLNEEQFFNQIKNRAKGEGVSSSEEWNDIVEEMINERLGVGEFDKDEDLEGLKEALKTRYEEYEAEQAA
jgi:hypothetical protein